MKKLMAILSILVMAFIISCSTGVKQFLKNPAFQDQNLPVREIKLVVFIEKESDQEGKEKFISECSDLLEEQVGMKLRIVKFGKTSWSGYSPIGKLNDLFRQAQDYKDWDMVVAFKSRLGWGLFAGIIDDSYRRYMIIGKMDKYVFLHEFFHAFIFDKEHSGCVMMSGFYPIGNRCLWLMPDDRKEVLKNKWRDFGIKPIVIGGYDFIKE